MTQEQIEELRKFATASKNRPDLQVEHVVFRAAANPAAILALIQQRDELLAALNRIQSTPPGQADGGGFVVDHFDGEGEYIGSQGVDPMWVVQEMASVANAAIAKAEAQS